VVPVLGGLLVIVAIGLFTWGIAAYISRGGAEVSERLAPSRFEVASIQTAARIVADDGPIMLPGLNTTTGERTLVLDHEGDDPTRDWHVYWAYPADRDPSCVVTQIQGTATFTDCDGRRLDVSALARPAGVSPVVENRETLSIDLRSPVSTTTTP
jgi:hypothetical protein